MSEPRLDGVRPEQVERGFTVTRSQVDAAMRALGFDPDETAALIIDAECQVTVVRRRWRRKKGAGGSVPHEVRETYWVERKP